MNETCQNPQMCCYIAGAVGFVAGVILTCIVCKLRGGCKCGGQNDASRRPAKRSAEPKFEIGRAHV